ncbi:MAG: cytochrome C oxidase subunit IV family protein [Acidobacteria bacterium]|nr:cytochrome C oxidase subunit IV family protein [Acidobacteriota bacterium]
MEKQQTPNEVSALISNALRPGRRDAVSPRAEEKRKREGEPRGTEPRTSPRLASLKRLMEDGDLILNLICVLIALGFLALAASNFTIAGSFLTIDSLFLTAVSLLLAGVFLINPALTLRERGMLKNPFAGGAETVPAVVEGPIHFEGSTRLFLYVLGGLLALTMVEVLLAYIHLRLDLMLTILMGLSIIKAAMIIAYFMHLRFERMSLVLTLVPILVICICLLFVFFPDSFRSHNLRSTRGSPGATATESAH